MPIYEYQCANCHAHSEHLQKISDPLLTICSECQQAAMVRLVSGAGFQLKGTGWYVTDFKNKDKPKEEPKKDKAS